jgi:mxaJ protein
MRALIAVLLLAPCSVWAHTLEPSGGQAGEWVLIALLFLAGAWYALGFRRIWPCSRIGRAMLARRGVLFAVGWLVIAGSLLSPLHRLGARSFTAHMIEHELLMLVAAPLIAFARPIGVFIWALPRSARHALAALGHRRWFAGPWRSISSPLSASLLQAAMLWLWHAPAFFDNALRSELWHAAQHLSLVASALLFWWSINTASSLERKHGVAGFYLFFTSVHSALLGALMAFADSPWYAQYARMGMSGTAGLTPLEDQQIAGLIMWVPGGAVHAVAALVYLSRWFRLPRKATVGAALGAILAVCCSTMVHPARAAAPSGPQSQARELKVCADPNNLPFSNRREQGFENQLARLVAHELHAHLTYVWWAQRRGNVRETLKAGLCDIIPGVASNLEMLATTRPYYRSAYVFVTRASDRLELSGFDDPRLRTLTIGVQMIGDDFSNTPPAHALTRRGIVDNIRGYMLYGDYAQENPPRAIVDDVASGHLDVAVVWGPLAGYFARRQRPELHLQAVSPLMDGPMLPMVFDISMGVRKEDSALRRELDEVLTRQAERIQTLLRHYSVPMVTGDQVILTEQR